VFVYRAPETGGTAEDWAFEGELPNAVDAETTTIGPALATDGRWIVAGYGQAGTADVRCGLAFVYHRAPGQAWSLHQTLGPFDPVNSGAFGNIVALNDGLLLVYGGDRLFHPDHGSVFLRRL
jgi:hypothetical protein